MGHLGPCKFWQIRLQTNRPHNLYCILDFGQFGSGGGSQNYLGNFKNVLPLTPSQLDLNQLDTSMPILKGLPLNLKCTVCDGIIH